MLIGIALNGTVTTLVYSINEKIAAKVCNSYMNGKSVTSNEVMFMLHIENSIYVDAFGNVYIDVSGEFYYRNGCIDRIGDTEFYYRDEYIEKLY